MRLCVLIITFNYMTRVFESNVLNGKYLVGYSMKLFETRVYCSNFFLRWRHSLSLGGHDGKQSQILNVKHVNASLRAYYYI